MRRCFQNTMYEEKCLVLVVVAILITSCQVFFSFRVYSNVHSSKEDDVLYGAPSLVGKADAIVKETKQNAHFQSQIESKVIVRAQRPPQVILHVGPHKTATTSLQSFIKEPQAIETLAKDNVSMPGLKAFPGTNRNFPEFNYVTCIKRGMKEGSFCRTELLPAMSNYLNQTYTKSKDVLIVAEDFDRPEIDCVSFKKVYIPALIFESLSLIVVFMTGSSLGELLTTVPYRTGSGS